MKLEGPRYIINEGDGILEIVYDNGNSREVEIAEDEMFDMTTGENLGWVDGDDAIFYDGSSTIIDW